MGLYNSQVDRIVTRDQDMHQRRVRNAADAEKDSDYVTLSQLKQLGDETEQALTDAGTVISNYIKTLDSTNISNIIYHNLKHVFNEAVKFVKGLVTPFVAPPADGTTAFKITKADGVTPIATFDTTNSRVGFGKSPIYNFEIAAAGAHPQFHLSNNPGGDDGFYASILGAASSYLTSGSVYTGGNWVAKSSTSCILGMNVNSLALYINSGLTAGTNFGPAIVLTITDTTMGFWGAAAAVKQTLNAYTPNTQSAAYTLTPAALTQAALLSDLNILRAAYENLRISFDDLRTKLRNTTLVG